MWEHETYAEAARRPSDGDGTESSEGVGTSWFDVQRGLEGQEARLQQQPAVRQGIPRRTKARARMESEGSTPVSYTHLTLPTKA